MLRFQTVTIDAHDPSALARFWAEVLGWQITDEGPIEVGVEPLQDSPMRGVVPDLLFIRVPDDKVAKNRLHLDLRPDDQAVEVERLTSLGASLVDIGQAADPHCTWVVMADPEGNEFCVLRSVPTTNIPEPAEGKVTSNRL